jgi:hypothetical protein
MFLMCLDLIFLKKHMQMLYVDHLQHGLDTSPFSIPCCAFLDSKTIQSVASMDRRGDVPSGRIEVQASQGKLQIYCVQLFQSLYEKCVICYFIYHSFLFSLFYYMQMRSVTDTCYGVSVDNLTVLPTAVAAPA